MQRVFLITGLVAVFMVLAAGCNTDRRADNSDTASNGSVSDFEFPAAKEFELTTISGDNVSLAQYKGKVLLINFWATWCGPCLEEMPMLIKLQDELGDEGLQILGISVDEEGEGVVVDFVEDYNINYPIAVDEIGDMATGYGAQFAVPTTIVIDRNGKINHRIIGLVDEATLRPLVNKLLEQS